MNTKKIFKTIKYSPLTKSKAHILVPFIDNEHSQLYKEFKSFNTGITLKSDTKSNDIAYSVCSGVVLCIDNYNQFYVSVTVQYDASTCVKYVGLKSTELRPNTAVQKGDIIGKYISNFMFEYFTVSKPESDEDILIWQRKILFNYYYLQNPEKLVTGELDLDADNVISETEVIPLFTTEYGEG